MSASTPQPDELPFTRVVVGVDGSPEAMEAARQACRLAPGRPVALVCAVDTLQEPARPHEVPALAHLMRERAADALAETRARLDLAGATATIGTAVEEGHPADVLRYALA